MDEAPGPAGQPGPERPEPSGPDDGNPADGNPSLGNPAESDAGAPPGGDSPSSEPAPRAESRFGGISRSKTGRRAACDDSSGRGDPSGGGDRTPGHGPAAWPYRGVDRGFRSRRGRGVSRRSIPVRLVRCRHPDFDPIASVRVGRGHADSGRLLRSVRALPRPPPSAPGSALASATTSDSTPQPGPTEDLPPQTAPTAHITFNELVLDPSGPAVGQARTFSFVSDGPGKVTVEVVASAPTNSSRVCLSGDGGTPVCSSGATPAASFYSQSSQSKWTATVISGNEIAPIVDVALTWPSNKPSVTATQVPFEGEPNPDSLRSLTATVVARSSGRLSLEAAWPPSPLNATLTIVEMKSPDPVTVDQATFKAATSVAPAHATNVKAGATYRITLMNQSPAGIVPRLTATIAFP